MPTKPIGRVIVVGSSNTDLVVHCAALPRAGETVLGRDLLTFAGGKGANQAVAAARAGARVHFIGAFGDDAFGRARRADLEREGIDCSGCVVKKGVPSGVALIGIGRGGNGAKAENLIMVAAGANARLSASDVRKGMPKKLRNDDVILCSLEIPMDAVLAALSVTDYWGPSKILNPAPLPPSGLPAKLLERCHFITPNETEFEMMTGSGVSQLDPGLVAKLSKQPLNVIVTRGAKGVSFADEMDGPILIRAPKVKPVDTVGAGDCFNGSLAAHWASHEQNILHSIEYAVTAASLKVTKAGAQAGMPKHAAIMNLLGR